MKNIELRTGIAALCAAAVTVPTTAYADVFCAYNIDSLYLSTEGYVQVGLGSVGVSPAYGRGWWLCSTNYTLNVDNGYGNTTVSPAACNANYTMLLTNQNQNKVIYLQFHGPNDCASASVPGDGVLGTGGLLYPANIVSNR